MSADPHAWKKYVSILFLAIALSFGIGSMTADNWVTDRNREYSAAGLTTDGETITYKVGLTAWRVNLPGCDGNLAWESTSICTWPREQLGDQQGYSDAGSGCLAAGAVALAFALFSLIVSFVFLNKVDMNKAVPAGLAWLSGMLFILGALIYEGKRGTTTGNAGYEFPMAIFLLAGIASDVAAFFLWWSGTK